MKLSAALDQYEKICLEAMQTLLHYDAKHTCLKPLGKRLRNLVVQILLLHIVMPRKINYTQMERFGTHSEKTYRQTHLQEINWLKFNITLMERLFKAGQRFEHSLMTITASGFTSKTRSMTSSTWVVSK